MRKYEFQSYLRFADMNAKKTSLKELGIKDFHANETNLCKIEKNE